MTNFINKKSCFIAKSVKIGKNVTIYENNHISGNTTIGDNTTILPNNFILNSIIGEDCSVHSSIIEGAQIGNGTSVGPYARIRPKTTIGALCKIGNFVEIKNSNVGDGSKISHLAYVGDTDMGKDCNIGCGAIFVNYNGKSKARSCLGNHVFVGSNCNIIAPVNLADNSYICAGTTVTENTKESDFVIGRAKQITKPGRAERYW